MQRNWIGRSHRRVGRLPVARRADHGVHDPSRHAVRGDVHGPRPGAPARRRPDHVRARPGRRRVPPAGRVAEGRRPPGREPSQDRGVHRLVRHQPGHRPGHPDLGRRLRADGLRHRGDHGRAVRRPARLRVRQHVRPRHPGDPAPAGRVVRRPGHRADARHVPLARGVHRRRPVRQLEQRRVSISTASTTSRRRSPPPTPGWRPTATARERSRTSCATGCSAASATGASRSRSCTTSTVAPTCCPTTSCPSSCPRPTASRRARSIPTTSSPTRRARSIG